MLLVSQRLWLYVPNYDQGKKIFKHLSQKLLFDIWKIAADFLLANETPV